MTKAAAFNRALGVKINREIWNDRQFDRIPTYFAEDFVSDYSPNVVLAGRRSRALGRPHLHDLALGARGRHWQAVLPQPVDVKLYRLTN